MSLKSSWIYRKLTGQIILITYNVKPDKLKERETLQFVKMSKAQAYSMGYVRGRKIKDELRYATFPIYVKFTPDIPPKVPYTIDSQQKMIENRETSSTLYDHFKSDAIAKFLKGMTTKTSLPKIDQAKLIMLAGIVIGAVVGVYFILR